MTSTMEIGKKLVDLCKQGKFHEAMESLYSKDIVSVEAMQMGSTPARIEGIAAVREKGEWWTKNHEVHGCEVEGPWPHGERFVAVFKMDITPKVGPMAGKRHKMEEAALYTVKDGKVAHEEFFYGM